MNEDDPTCTGEIAHIVGSADDGPRGDPDMSPEDRDRFSNLLVLCPTCHTLVDKPQNLEFYTTEILRDWRIAGITAYAQSLKVRLPLASYKELHEVCRHLVGSPGGPTYPDTTLLNPSEKMQRNSLSPEIQPLIQLGETSQARIQEFLRSQDQINPGYSRRLIGWFKSRYALYYAEHGLEEADVIYLSLYGDVRGSTTSFVLAQVAASVLAYCFIECEIFEKR